MDTLYLRTGSMFVGPSLLEVIVTSEPVAVPEPTTLGLLGLSGLLLLRRRRSTHRPA
jgi:hypothetical protein